MRLFVAVNLPAEVREGIWEAAGPLREQDFPVRWVRPDAQHITLKFLGEVQGERLDEIVRAVEAATVGARPFALPIADFGAFPSPARPRVVWAGCDGVPPLELLQDRIEREMGRLGFEIEGRPFRPHVTLGRAKRGARARHFAGFEELMEGLTFHAEPLVRSVDVMQSTLSPRGARYEVRHAAELAG